MSRLLLVDDDERARNVGADMLRSRGWTVESAADMRAAMEIAMVFQPGVIVTELLLPDTRGFQFGRTLRSAIDDDVKLIAVTSAPSRLFAEALSAGFDHVFAKPIDVDLVERHAGIQR